MKFGVEIPTCTAGMMYPVPFATAQDVVRVAVEAEQLGYYDVAGNDHLSTQQYVRQAWKTPPDYFEPLITMANVAAKTSVVRLTTGILVLPMRDPVLLAKQVATLDQLSGGRVTLGVAVGGYRDEFESVVPDLRDASRADLISEGIEALRVLFNEPRSTYQGKYRRFSDVESFPKPVQSPLPIYSAATSTARYSAQPQCARAGCRPRSAPSGFAPGDSCWRPTPGRPVATRRRSPSPCSQSYASGTRPPRRASGSRARHSTCSGAPCRTP